MSKITTNIADHKRFQTNQLLRTEMDKELRDSFDLGRHWYSGSPGTSWRTNYWVKMLDKRARYELYSSQEESIEEPVYAGTFTPSGFREHFDSVGFFELEEDCWREIGLGYTAEVIDFLDTGMAFDEEYEQSRFEELQIWLEENVVHFFDPKELTLFDFEVNWSNWSGKFKIRFDDFVSESSFGLGTEMTGVPKFYYPMFTSPLGVPASYAAIEITSNTHNAINEALKRTFPKLKPLGKNRDTGIQIMYNSPIEARLSREVIEETKALVVEGYSITVQLDDLQKLKIYKDKEPV